MAKSYHLLALIACLFFYTPLCASKKVTPRDLRTDEMMQQIDDLKHQLHILTTERDLLDEQVRTHTLELNDIHKQLSNKAQTELGKSPLWEKRFHHFEKTQSALVEDLNRLKVQGNEMAHALTQCQKEMQQTRLDFEANIAHLKRALDALVKIVQKDDPTLQAGALRTYKVKPGDSLEKIAKALGTTVQELKKRNNLKQDRIIVGQELQIE